MAFRLSSPKRARARAHHSEFGSPDSSTLRTPIDRCGSSGRIPSTLGRSEFSVGTVDLLRRREVRAEAEAAAMSQDSVEPADPGVLGLGRAVERLVISLPSSQVPDDFALTVIFHWNGYSDHLHLADL